MQGVQNFLFAPAVSVDGFSYAVREFINRENPPHNVYYHILNNERATRLLVETPKVDINKECGNDAILFFDGMDLGAFKLLVDHGYDFITNPTRTLLPGGRPFPKRFSCLQLIVASSNSAYLRYFLEKRVFKMDDICNEEQVRCWIRIGNEESIRLLKDYGFEINARDSEGHTALTKLVSSTFYELSSDPANPGLDRYVRMAALARHGASF